MYNKKYNMTIPRHIIIDYYFCFNLKLFINWQIYHEDLHLESLNIAQ